MSTVVKMLTGDIEVYNRKITKPGLISDFMDLKVRGPAAKTKPEMRNLSSYNVSSSSDNFDTPPLSSDASIAAATTTTTITQGFDQTI